LRVPDKLFRSAFWPLPRDESRQRVLPASEAWRSRTASCGDQLQMSGSLNLSAFGNHLREFFVFDIIDTVGVVVVRERPLLDFLNVLADSGDRDVGQVRKTFSEFRLEIGEDAEQIMTQQDLA